MKGAAMLGWKYLKGDTFRKMLIGDPRPRTAFSCLHSSPHRDLQARHPRTAAFTTGGGGWIHALSVFTFVHIIPALSSLSCGGGSTGTDPETIPNDEIFFPSPSAEAAPIVLSYRYPAVHSVWDRTG